MNHRLPIEYGRFLRIERAKRKCKLCDDGDLDITICLNVAFSKGTVKFNKFFGTEDIDILQLVAVFCKMVVTHFDRTHK